MEEGCTCIAVKEREEAERTGYVKLYEFVEGEDEDGNPCPMHDPRKKTTMSDQDTIRQDRAEQLRALIVSWAEDSTFLSALNKQQREIEEGTCTLNPEWAQVADEILGGYMSVQAKMKWPDGEEPKEEPKEEPSRIILP